MSIVVSLVGKEAIVIGADTICIGGDDTAHYCDRHSKLYKASNPQFAIGLAGSKGADRFLQQREDFSHLDFDATVTAYSDLTFADYSKGNRTYDFYYLICGYDRFGEQRIERVRFERDHSNNGQPVSDVEPVLPKHAIGISKHGAWYVLANYFRKGMSTDETMLLAYLCLREVIRHDERTRNPIEMMVVKCGVPVRKVGSAELEQLGKETEKRIREVESVVQAPFTFLSVKEE